MKANIISTSQLNGEKVVSKSDLEFVLDTKGNESSIVNIYPQISYQEWEGFGGALTESSAYTMAQMPPDQYNKIVQDYYGKDGLGYNMCRLHLDSCDFSLDNYCAVEDEDFSSFTLERDEKYILPLVEKVKQTIQGELIAFISPWSPPAFMKDNKQRNGGGKLLKSYYAKYAEYFCKYIKEYQDRGVNISRLTIQNEPLAVQRWDSCVFTSEEERDFLKNYLYPEMQAQGLENVGVYIWDHNKERVVDRAMEIIDDETNDMVEGIAFHWYSGDHFEALELFHSLYPNKKLMHSEGCVEYSRFGAGNGLQHAEKYAHDIIGNMNAGANSYVDWNIVLDEKGGPNHVFNYCAAPIMCDTQTKTIKYNLTYDYIGHFSKYIRPNAKRIGWTKYTDKIEVTAFQNCDGGIVAVILNRSDECQEVNLRLDNHIANINIDKNSICTVCIEL